MARFTFRTRPGWPAAVTAAALVVVASAGCGSSDDAADVADQDEEVAQDDTSPDATQESGGDGSGGDDGGGDDGTGGDEGSGGDEGQTEVTPGEVGTVVAGRAVATVSGTPNEPDQQSGDVTRVDQDCRGRDSMTGLEAGAAVTILDASTGEVVGTGEVDRTSATELSDGSDGNLPVWECYFHIAATATRSPDSIRVQVAGLAPWDVTGSIDDFEVPVQGSDGSSTDSTLPTGSSEPFVETTPPSSSGTTPQAPDTTPPPEAGVTSPST